MVIFRKPEHPILVFAYDARYGWTEENEYLELIAVFQIT